MTRRCLLGAGRSTRSGQLSALGRDLLDFIDALQLEHPILVGHDWGARAVANACGLRQAVASRLVMLSVGYGTNDPNQAISLQQARNYWYHWFMATPRGEKALRDDPRGFARQMWDTWSPPGWYDEQEFLEATKAFEGSDWVDVVLHSYRWQLAKGDLTYDDDEHALFPTPMLSVPTLILHGDSDACNHPDSSNGKDHYFSGHYERLILPGIGHFPQRESPKKVGEAILRFCGT